MWLSVAAISAATSGCAGQNTVYDTDVATLIGDRYSGRPVEVLFSRYGVPMRQAIVKGHDAYTWEIQVRRYFSTQPPADFRCQLDIYALDGLTKYVNLSGHQGACVEFIP